MTSVATPSTIPTDSPEARRYNRIKRWLGIADFVLGLILLLALLVTGWSGTLRDLAYSGGFQNYTLAVFLYVLMLMGIGKLLGLGLDYYGFRLEHRFQLSNQKLRAWIWDEFKGFLVGVILASIVTELLYFIIREAPQHWWLLAWAAFLGLFVLLAQIAPVVLFPIFYKFEPLEDEELKSRLVRLSQSAGTRVRGVYKWKLAGTRARASRTPAYFQEHPGASRDYAARILGGELDFALRHRTPSHVRDAFRFRQPASAGPGVDNSWIPASPRVECLFTFQRAPSRPLRFSIDRQHRTFYFFNEQACRAESSRTHTFQIRGMVLPLASGDCKADRCGRKLGGASDREFTSISTHVHRLRRLCSNCRKSSSVSTPMLS